MKKVCLAFLFFIFANPAFADTTAFGMTLGKTTESEARKMYSLKLAGTNKHSRGNMYLVLNSNVMADLKSLMFVFDGRGSLMAIQAVFPNRKRKEIFDSLSKKYKLVYNRNDFGDRLAGFDGGDTEIDMRTLANDSDTTLLYSHKLFVAMQADVEKEEKIQNRKEMDATL